MEDLLNIGKLLALGEFIIIVLLVEIYYKVSKNGRNGK